MIETEARYIAFHKDTLEHEFERTVANEDSKNCSMTYELLSRIPDGIVEIVSIFERHTTASGKTALAAIDSQIQQNPRIYLETLIDLHKMFFGICKDTFSDNPAFVAAVDKVRKVNAVVEIYY
jgi:Cullin family